MYKKYTKFFYSPPGYMGKLLLMMKLTSFILALTLMQVSAATFGQKVTLVDSDISYEQVFLEIRKQTGYSILVRNTHFNTSDRTKVNFQNIPLTQVLGQLLEGTGLGYLINDKSIIIKATEKTVIAKVKDFFLEEEPKKPRQLTITGRVSDTSGAPLPGAVVQVKGTSNGTFTKENGTFKLINVPEDAVLEFKMLGFDEVEIPVNSRTAIQVVLKMSLSPLDEVQVIGFGTTTRRFSTGSISVLTSEEIEKQPIMNPLLTLQGRVPGLYMRRIGLASSSPIEVELRGRNSLNPETSNKPLYVIDGIPQTTLTVPGAETFGLGSSSGIIQGGYSHTRGQSILFNINPRDIESISVLKGGDATAIYGSRAANGVILITTKKSVPGRTSLNVNLEQGLVMVSRFPDLLNLEQYLAVRREAFKNDGITPTIVNAPDLMLWDTTRTTDWYREMLGTGRHTNVMASLSGGGERANFRLSSSYTDRVDLHSQSGGNKRATVALRTNYTNTSQKLHVDLMVNYAYSKVDAINSANAYTLPPNAPSIFNEMGNLNYAAWNPEGGAGNFFPFSYLLRPNAVQTHNLNSSLGIRYAIAKGLTVSGSTHFSSINNTNDSFTPIASQGPVRDPTGTSVFGRTKTYNVSFDPQINYIQAWGKGRLNAFLGGTLQSANSTGTTITGRGYTNDDLMKNINNAPIRDVSEGYAEYRYAAVFGRINYNWDSKYVLNINGRRDGSSRFAPGKQFGNFGSIGLAWIVSEENWLQTVLPSWLSFVKLRGSYAITGSDGIGDYQYLSQYSVKPSSGRTWLPLDPYNGIQPYVPILPANQQYQWESLKSVEGALNLGFVDDRINLELAWYQKRSGNQLTQLPTPIYTGFSEVTANWIATVQNRGLEASVSAELIKRHDLRLNMTFNISKNRNKLIAYPGIEQSPYATDYKVGSSLGTKYFLNLLGVDPLTGKYMFEDYNKDGMVTKINNNFPGTGRDDRNVVANMDPSFQGGLGTNLHWKNYSLSLNFYFVKELAEYPYSLVHVDAMRNIGYSNALLRDRWQKPGDQTTFARFSTKRISGQFPPVDGSFIRLSNVAFTYNLSEKMAQKIGMQRANFSLRVQNVFTLTSYPGEPEFRNGRVQAIPRTVVGALSFTF